MRLFVALGIPEETREALADLIARLRKKRPSARWVQPESMHVTLKFIGHTGDENLAAIQEALAQIHSAVPVDLRFRGVGFFPNEKRPRIFWCGVEASPNASEIAGEMDRAVIRFGVEPEKRPFTPHLTLARFKEDGARKPAGVAEIVSAARELAAKDFGALRTREFHLFESKTKPSGAEYKRLATFRFTEAT
ncbi:MAG TPA: RNA 2',3'-cyclic phosphodiesterase [Candidatus Aquilonibacter sp.]|nr:RNA 2',3'-cyclic phosphodiesterase [Candidatus Aquilonibacter sp.]